MCNKAVGNYPHALKFVPECYKTQKIFKMCGKAVDTYRSTIKFVPECFMTREMCDKVVNTCFLYWNLFLIGIKLKNCVTELFLNNLF